MKIKLCGLSRDCDIEYANEARPDYVGFVFAKSRRQVTATQAEALKKRLDSGISAVGVFVNEDIDTVAALVKSGIIDLVQLHGREDNSYIKALRKNTACPIIKAVNPGAFDGFEADYLLYDNGAGGTGSAFDWTAFKPPGKPFFLAGGLHIGNIEEAIQTIKPFAVDISSGIETDGLKDRTKILEIVRRIRHE